MSSFLLSNRLRLAAFASVALAAITGAAIWQSASALNCPVGYEKRDPAIVAREFIGRMTPGHADFLHQKFGSEFCALRNLPESMMEQRERELDADIGRAGQTGHALRLAIEQQKAMAPIKATIEGANGQWVAYGYGPQTSLPEYQDGFRAGIPEVEGRADSFAYDSAAKRLFVAIGYGGIWMSEAVNGDVATLADNWVAIGDNLPTLVNSAVAWMPSPVSRVFSLTGEHVQGGNTYVGLGGYWSDDLGKNWHLAKGLPDGAGAGKLAVDLSNPKIVYAATHKGLFRSDDAGESFVNVNLPTGECAGVVTDTGPCSLANVVTDVVIRQPGGIDATALSPTKCDPTGCTVMAAVGYRGGNNRYSDGTPQSPANGLYVSKTGAVDDFAPITYNAAGNGAVAVGFAPQNRIGRVELGAAEGPLQDHNYVYAIVEDARLFNSNIPFIDMDAGNLTFPADCSSVPDGDPRFVCKQYSGGFAPTTINGVYVSRDFGGTWIRLADDLELTYNLTTGSSLAGAAALGVGPGVQSWYDLWIKPDPTQATLGAPTRLTFGMEEVWKNRSGGTPLPVTGLEQTTNDFKVIGTYFAGETCLFLIGNIGPPTPVCPVYDGVINGTTTHPDQHDGIYVPDDKGGVWLIVGNDGGVFKQYSANPLTDDFANNKWGRGANHGFFTLFNYGISVANDGTVWYGLQDNSSGKIEPNGRHVDTYVGDGMWTAVDPNNSNLAYVQTPNLAINRTNDGGQVNNSIAPGAAIGTPHFLSPFVMDPLNPEHLVAAGTMVAELQGASSSGSWTTLFDLSTGAPEGAISPQSRSRALEVRGNDIYAGWCGPCQVLNAKDRNALMPGAPLPVFQFQRGLATNVGGEWHQASVKGLPNRYIYDIEIDESNSKTVYVVLGDYSTSRWLKPGQYEDTNPNIGKGHVFKSTDAGENFKDISGNLPDVITTAVLQRGKQLIVGTDIGVFISDNLDGKQWAPLGNGLPNVPVNQLVLKPDDSTKLFAATFGRGVQLYTFDKAVKSETVVQSSRSGHGLLLGALSPALLLLLGFGSLLRRRAD